MSDDATPAKVRLTDWLGAGAERGDTVHGLPRLMTKMIVCEHCGDKRCLHAHSHSAPCAKVDLYAHNAWVERMALRSAPASGDDMPQPDAVIALGAWKALNAA